LDGLTSSSWNIPFLSAPPPLGDLARRLITKAQNATVFSPYFYLGVLALFAAERVLPARNQGVLSTGLAQDAVWFLVNTIPLSTVIMVYAELLATVYKQYLDFLTIGVVTGWSASARFVMFLVVSDLLNWMHHFVRHKVEVFWYFHTVHHSQRQMNLFTDHRVHFVEFLVANTLIFIPSMMFQLSTVSLGYFLIFFRWYARMYHANLRTNFGPFKHILVTPQSHRIHHSVERRHFDTNFGTLFTIWDRLFGTLYKNYDEYPDTGLSDDRFPLETATGPMRGLFTLWAQTVYPFRLLARRIGVRRTLRAGRVTSPGVTAPATTTPTGGEA
jgi:sterol desaturase/sphingolipid hydroxylase (fatty acid hydroxylase superfamily)